MNRRTLKKHCKRAMRILIERHGYRADSFAPAEGDEAIYAPSRMERQHRGKGLCRHFLEPGPLKGTPLLTTYDSYTDEYDEKLPSEVLREIELWSSLTEEEAMNLLAPASGAVQMEATQ